MLFSQYRGLCIILFCTGEFLDGCVKITLKQEAFRERRHLHACDLWRYRVTLTLRQGQEGLYH